MSAKPHPAAAALAFFVAILAIAAASIFVRQGQAEGMPSLVIAALRLAFSVIPLALILAVRRHRVLPRLSRSDLRLALLSGFFLALHFATWISSLGFTSVAASVVLVATAPIWVALAAPFLLGERLTPALATGVVMALAGGVLVLAGGGEVTLEISGSRPVLGSVLALCGALAVAGYFMIGRHLRPRLSLLDYVTVVYGIAALFLLASLPLFGASVFGHTPAAYLACFWLALFPQLIGHSTYNWALRHLPASSTSLLVLGEPVGAIILAVLILDEVPLPLQLVGCGLVLLGILVGGRVSGAASGQRKSPSR